MNRLFLLSRRWKQFVPRAVKPLLEAYQGCNQDIGLSGFNLLKCANVQVGFFGKRFLGDFPQDASTPQIPAKFTQLPLFCNWNFHKRILYKKGY